MVYCAVGNGIHFFRKKESLIEHVELLFEALDLGEISDFKVWKDIKNKNKLLLAVSFNNEDNGMYREWVKIITPKGKYWTCPYAWRRRFAMPPLYNEGFELISNKSSMKSLVKEILKEKRK